MADALELTAEQIGAIGNRIAVKRVLVKDRRVPFKERQQAYQEVRELGARLMGVCRNYDLDSRIRAKALRHVHTNPLGRFYNYLKLAL